MSVFILLLVVAFIAMRFLSDRADRTPQWVRDAEKIEQRRAALVRAPDSPASHEFLGDALRAGGRYEEARTAYETARRLMEEHEPRGAGHIGGGGLDNKLRLVTLDIAEEEERRASYRDRVNRREMVCRRCGYVNAPDASHCDRCEGGLLTNTVADAWRRDDIRHPLLREVREGAAILFVVLLAVYLASWMPIEIKGVLLLSTVIVLVVKGLRAITDNSSAGRHFPRVRWVCNGSKATATMVAAN
jgi:ribosomal protein L40E